MKLSSSTLIANSNMLEDIREFFKEFGKLLSKPVFGATPTEELIHVV
jgi:hypothetical protein